MAKTQSDKGKAAPARRSKPAAKRSTGEGNADQRILAAIETASTIENTEAPSRDMVNKIAGFTDPKSSTIRNAYAKLKKMKLIEIEGTTVRYTEAGRKAAGPAEQVTTNEQYHAIYKKQINSSASLKIFELLAKAGTAMDAETIAEEVGIKSIKSSTWRNALAPLRKLNLLEEVDKQCFQLSDRAFPFGRP